MTANTPNPARPFRLLVVLHNLELGGSQRNAIDLADGARDLGHEVMVAGPPGVLVEAVRASGLPFVPLADEPNRALATAVPGYKGLLELSRSFRPDLIHTYELTPSIHVYLGPHLRDAVPMTMTINSMSVPEFMPASVPLQVCSPLIAAETHERAGGQRSGPVGVLEIPTNCVDQYPGYPGAAEFRAELGVEPDELLVVVVSRFARALKQEGLETAIRAAGRLAPRHRMRLVLVGEGPATRDLQALAERVNAQADREIVIMAGPRVDPRPAYASADVALGMGGSLLRAMAFGKACLVQGEHGFFRILDAGSAREFRWRGFYGIGDGGTGEELLADLLDRMLSDADLRADLGRFAHDLVHRHYSLEHAVGQQMEWYRSVLAGPRHTPERREVARTVAAVGSWLGKRAVLRPGGREGSDYFNSSGRIGPGIKAAVPAWFDPDLPTQRQASEAETATHGRS
jgi:Glycosyl transferases group 1